MRLLFPLLQRQDLVFGGCRGIGGRLSRLSGRGLLSCGCRRLSGGGSIGGGCCIGSSCSVGAAAASAAAAQNSRRHPLPRGHPLVPARPSAAAHRLPYPPLLLLRNDCRCRRQALENLPAADLALRHPTRVVPRGRTYR